MPAVAAIQSMIIPIRNGSTEVAAKQTILSF
jgi:hypothetical protein